MKKIVILTLLALTFSPALADPGKILMVVTSHGTLGDTGKNTGFYLSEVTHPYEVFTQAGHEVEFASPQGGAPPMDGLDKIDDISKRLLTDAEFLDKLTHSKSPADLNPSDYEAVFYAGGHGTMWDFPDNPELQKFTVDLYQQGGVVAAVCHGPAALVNLKLADGRYLVDGQEVAAFTNEEESAVGLTEVMPFLLETRLRERGAKFVKAPNFEKKVAVGKGLVTGQNPASATGTAEEVVSLLKGR